MNPRAPAASEVRFCPYSRETLAGCRLYRPRSEHGAGPDAAECAFSVATEPGPYLRTVICRRRRLDGRLEREKSAERQADLHGRALARRTCDEQTAADRLGPRA